MAGDLRPWELLGSELAFDHRWYRVRRDTVRLPSGRVVDDYLVSLRPDVARLCAVTSYARLVLVRQWKQGVRSFMLELPGGVCDDNEDPAVTAGRELTEETGYICPNLTRLGSFELDPSKNSNSSTSTSAPVPSRRARPRWTRTSRSRFSCFR